MVALIRNYVWPAAIVAFLVLVAAVNFFLLRLSFEHPSPYLEDSPYERGLSYEQEIQERKLAADLGWKISGPELTEGFEFEFEITYGPHARPAVDAIALHAKRFDQPELDRSGRVVELPSGRYRTDFTLPAAGLWLIRVSFQRDDSNPFIEQKIYLR